MPRAPKKCGRPDCQQRVTGRTYCPNHTPVWRGSTRRSRLPADWDTRRAAAQTAAHGRCEMTTRLNRPHHRDCNGTGTECDHITAGDNHEPTNLCWLSTPCHKVKTASETRARNRTSARRSTP